MDITAIIAAISSLLVGGGGVGAFMYHKQTKRAKELDNEKIEIENDNATITQWKDLYYEAEKKSQAKSKRLEELYQRLAAKSEQLAKMTALRDKLAAFKCFKMDCTERRPPLETGLDCDDCNKKNV